MIQIFKHNEKGLNFHDPNLNSVEQAKSAKETLPVKHR